MAKGEKKRVRWNLSGRISNLLWGNVSFVITLVAILFLYIVNGYSTQNDLMRIETLKRELETLRYQSLNIISEVSAKSKPSYIEDVVQSGELSLQITSEPPFKLSE